jgi:hypothetical protein
MLPEGVLRLDRVVDVEDNLGAVSFQFGPLPGKEQLPADLHAGLHTIHGVHGQLVAGSEVPRIEGAEGACRTTGPRLRARCRGRVYDTPRVPLGSEFLR